MKDHERERDGLYGVALELASSSSSMRRLVHCLDDLSVIGRQRQLSRLRRDESCSESRSLTTRVPKPAMDLVELWLSRAAVELQCAAFGVAGSVGLDSPSR
eukprot:scaffold923_cov256-Pinguiococcus_pyrenoidosus.AAC.32